MLGVAEHVGSEEGVAREQEAGEGVAPASARYPPPLLVRVCEAKFTASRGGPRIPSGYSGKVRKKRGFE